MSKRIERIIKRELTNTVINTVVKDRETKKQIYNLMSINNIIKRSKK